MKTVVEKIFAGIFCVVVAAMPVVGRAASNGCDNDKNDHIYAGLGLCSVHAYNIGAITNPTTEAERQMMRDVIALKTTIMTQQIYKQYEYLDATIKRMKTQLEKAILTTKLQAAGASSSESSSGVSGGSLSTNRNTVLKDAYDCTAEATRPAAFDCLSRNLNAARSAANSGNYGEAGRQLQKDHEAFRSWAQEGTNNQYKSTVEDACSKEKGLSKISRDSVNSCINAMNIGLVNAREAYENSQRKSNGFPWGG